VQHFFVESNFILVLNVFGLEFLNFLVVKFTHIAHEEGTGFDFGQTLLKLINFGILFLLLLVGVEGFVSYVIDFCLDCQCVFFVGKDEVFLVHGKSSLERVVKKGDHFLNFHQVFFNLIFDGLFSDNLFLSYDINSAEKRVGHLIANFWLL
jgi:hypothetical protein